MHITIIGSGAFACALAHLLSKNNTNTIHIWTHDKNWKEISEKKKHYLLFDQQYPIKDNTIIHTDLTESIKKSTIIFLAISSQFFPSITEHLKETPLKNKTIFIGTKAMNYLFKIKEPFIEELMGDFFLTGTMSESRNLSFGQALTLGKKDDFLKNNTVEGYVNIDAINIYLKEKKMSLPIFNTLYLITKKEGNPSLILSSFLSD